EARARLRVPDLGWVAAGVGALRRVSGAAEVEVVAEGPAREPRLLARIEVSGGEVRPAAAMVPVRNLSLEALADRGGLWLQALRGELGGAPFQVTGRVDWAGSAGPRLDLALAGRNLLLHRDDSMQVRADLALAVAGPVDALEVSGEVRITEGRFVRAVDLTAALQGRSRPKADGGLQLFSFRDPPLRDLRFDVAVTAARPFEIKTNLAAGGLRPALRLRGTGQVPVLVGEVYLEPTRVTLPAGRLQVDAGVIRFPELDPDRPRIDLSASSRMLGYDIQLGVEGPYDEPTVTLSSVPPLAEEDLLLLVLTGKPPEAPADRSAAERTGLNVAVYLGKSVLARWLGGGSPEADESLLDRFELELGRGVTRLGRETLEAQFRLADAVFLEGDQVFLTAERDLFDAYNAGVKFVVRFR
ncbi:MAG: translocation/assembly module TamB domain-containing protein, partial [Deferrisomatales bacterium]